MAARLRAGLPAGSHRGLIVASLRRAPSLLGPGGLLLLGTLALTLPLLGNGFNLSFPRVVNVPEFILAAIAANTTWTLAYLALTLVVAALAYLLALTFHLIVIGRLTAGRAMVASIALTLRQPWVLARRHLAPARGRRGRQSTSGIDWLRELFAAP